MISTDEGGVLEANAAAERLLGRTREEIVSAAGDVLRNSRLREAVEERRREGSFRGRLRLVHSDGTTFKADVGAVELGDGRVGVVFHEADGEARVAARSSGQARVEGFFQALVENRGGVVILSGGDGVIRYASPSVEPILGNEPEEVIGFSLAERLHPDDRERVMEVFSGEPSKARVWGVFRLLHGDGGWVGVEGSVENLSETPR